MALTLTSPYMRGDRVLRAQRLLAANRWGDFLAGQIDGVYGPLTAASTRRAKYWLGYAKPDQRFGKTLAALLRGEERLPTAYRVRRARRLQAAKASADKPTIAGKAILAAEATLGWTEHPAGSNHSTISEWYGIIGPWCGMAVSYWYTKAGYDGFGTYADNKWICYVPSIVAKARAGESGLYVVEQPKPGDLVCYDWNGGVADHVGLYERASGGGFLAIEGNTAVGDDSNGGRVMRRERHASQVEAFVRVRGAHG